MLFQLFPTLSDQLSPPTSELLSRWSAEFFTYLPQSTVSQMVRRLREGAPPSSVLCCSPVLSKLSQVLARDSRLSPVVRKELEKLESSTPRNRYRELRQEISRRCPPGVRLGRPLSEGSLAVVFSLSSRGRDGVAKILKSGIREQLRAELRALEESLSFLQSQAHKAGLPDLDYTDLATRVRRLLLSELDLGVERKNLHDARAHFDQTKLAIPEPWEFSDQTVLFMDRLYGGELSESSARCAISQLVVKPLFHSEEYSLLHGDLHGGNLMTCDDGRVGVLDWGLCLKLDRKQRSQLSRLTASILFHRKAPCLRVLTEMGLEPGEIRLEGDLSDALDGLLEGCRGELPEWLVVLRKTLHQFRGVLQSTGSAQTIDQVVLSEGLQQLILEWPFRWLVGPNRRDVFGSNLSTADLWSLALPL